MNTLTQKDKLALQVSLALVAGMFSIVPVAQGAPMLEKTVTSGTVVNQKVANVTTVTSNASGNNVINWKDFSVAQNEAVVFDATNDAGTAYTKTNNYLNVVTGNGTSYIDGKVQGGNNVYLVNPQGVIMGKNAQVDVGNLYVSTKNIDPENYKNTDLSPNKSVLEDAVLNEDVVNMGKIQANSVYAEGTNIRFLNTADVTLDGSTPLTGVTLNTVYTDNSSTTPVQKSGYVHVGYEASSVTQTRNKSQYASPTVTKTATTLGYKINGKTLSSADTNNGVNDYDYALVHNKYELQNMDSNLAINYMLADNIAFDDPSQVLSNFDPIGGDSKPFTGNFDGNFYTVSNLKNITYSHDYTGLFGRVTGTSTKKSTIMNVGVVDVFMNAKAGKYAGGIAGYIENVDLVNVYNKATDPTNPKYIGAMYDTATISYNNGIYNKFSSKVGGLVGYAKDSNIESAYNTGGVTNGGGLVGELVNSNIMDAYNAGKVQNYLDYAATYSGSTVTGVYQKQHYAIADNVDSTSTVENVYGSGSYAKIDKSGTTTPSTATPLAPSTTNFTNAYQIDSSTLKVVSAAGDTSSANYLNNNNVYSNNGSAKSADNFGFFETYTTGTTKKGHTKSEDGVWRIYEGNTLPLLRSFLKANGQGTIPVSYNYALYATPSAAEANIPTMTLNGTNADGTITYNGYYIGIANVTSDSVRTWLDPNKIGSDASVTARNVNASLTAFYSTGQDGYDIAGDTLTITKRSLAPKSSRNDIDKVYDGNNKAAVALDNNLFEKIDLRNYSTDPGYGFVEVYDANGNKLATQDDVKLKSGFIDTTNTVYDSGKNVTTTPSHITLAFGSDYTADTTLSGLEGTAAGNYSLTAADFNNVSLYGNITPRPYKVALNKDTDLAKTYDGTAYVTYDSTTTMNTNTGAVVHADNNINKALNTAADTGFVSGDKVSIEVIDAFYSTDGTKENETANANTTANAYKAVYVLDFAGDDAKNYKFQDANGEDLTNNTLTGKGNINKRNVTLDNIAFYDGLNGTGNLVDNEKPYDFTSAYNDAQSVSFTSAGQATIVQAVNGTKTDGVVSADQSSFQFDLNSATFYNGNTSTATEAKTVNDATHIKYVLKTKGDATKLANYTLNGQDINTNGTVDIYRTGKITPRTINIDMLQSTGIDKIYDGTDAVEDRKNLGYEKFQGTSATSTVNTALSTPGAASTVGYVGYKSGTTGENKLVVDDVDANGTSLNDGTTFVINAKYTTAGADGAGTTTDAKDVYINGNNQVAAKKIEYTVSLSGDYAGNYELVGNSAVTPDATAGSPKAGLAATGTINPRGITGVTFADVEKYYDGSDQVGAVNNVTQSNNQIKVTGVTLDQSDGVTSINESLDVILGTNGGVVQTAGITGTYGTPNATTFNPDAHAYSGATRQVKYEGVQNITSGNPNYSTANISNVVYGSGKINPLKINELSASGTGNIDKIYDGTTAVVGGWDLQYKKVTIHNSTNEQDIDGYIMAPAQTTVGDVQAALGTITGTGTGADNKKISIAFGSGDYTVDTTNTVYDSAHVQTGGGNNGVTKITYAVNLNNQYGDFELLDSATVDNNTSGYTSFGANGAKIDKANANLIKPRVVYTQGVTGLSKTYDGTAAVKDANGNTLTGEGVVRFNTADNTTGLTGNDGVTNVSTAVYSKDSRAGYDSEDANVVYDSSVGSYVYAKNADNTDATKTVTYTVKLSNENVNGDYEIYKDTNGDGYYAIGDVYDMTGNDIKQADLTIEFKDIKKAYDTNAYVMNHGSTTVALDASYDDTSAQLTGVASGDNINFTTKDTSAFTKGTLATNTAIANPNADAADAGRHKVRYDLYASATDGKDLKNYRLKGSDGSDLVVTRNNDGSYNVTAYGEGNITPLTIKAIVATIDDVTKVYDGDTSLTYDHLAPLYDSSQVKSAKAKDSVTQIVFQRDDGSGGLTTALTLTLQQNPNDYTVNDGIAYTHFGDANVGEGKTVDYSITVDSNIIRNLEMDPTANLGTTDAAGNFTFTRQTHNNKIEAKNINATLSSMGQAANPTKEYDGDKTVLGKSYNGTALVDAAEAKSYVDVTGLIGTDSYTVDAQYQSKDVALDNSGHVAAYRNDIVYTVNAGNNYNVINKDSTGVTINALTGTGTIEPRAITIDATIAEKTYDTYTKVKLDATAADHETGDQNPTFSFSNLVSGETLGVAINGTNAISGEYVTEKNGVYVADENVEANSGNPAKPYKAVKYSNVAKSLTAGSNTLLTNYKLVDNANDANAVYDANNDELLFKVAAQKGIINKRSINQIVVEWATEIKKEYDATDEVLNPTDQFHIYGVSTAGTTTIKTPIAYNLVTENGKVLAVYGTLNANEDGVVVDPTNKDAGINKNVSYKIGGLKSEALQNFELNNVYTDGYTGWFTNAGIDTSTGTITKRVISGVKTGEKQYKTYDGNAEALSDSTYFNIDADDMAVLNKDGQADSVLQVTAAYAKQPAANQAYEDDKNANVDPGAELSGGKKVKYTIEWANQTGDTSYRSNYEFDTKNGGGSDGSGTDYLGDGDIVRRIVYVKDGGGRFQDKVYDGTTDLVVAPAADRFTKVDWSGDTNDKTGIIDNDVSLAINNVSGHFLSPDVVRDTSGNAQLQAVEYYGDISLSGANAGNYYLEATGAPVKLKDANDNVVVESNVTSIYDNGQLVITEEVGGIIKPQPITISVAHSPVKDYDSGVEVKGDYDSDTHYATASNLASAAANGANIVSQYAVANSASSTLDNDGKILHIDIKPKSTEDKTDEVLVTITGAPSYTDKNASTGDKLTTYNLSWTNGNYELVGQAPSASAGSQDDTFSRNGYSKGGDTASDSAVGVLTDYAGTIDPLVINIETMDSSKIYDGTTESVKPKVNVTFDNNAQNVLVADGATNVNSVIQKLGLTVENGTYAGPTQEALARAIGLDPDDPDYQTDLADQDNQDAMTEMANATDDADAAFDEKSDPFKHEVHFSGISITNGNYKLAGVDTDGKVDYYGTGIINRAPITAKGNDVAVKVGENMPEFSGKMSGFASQVDYDYYNGLATWGPEVGVSTGKAGTNPVYGWYRNLKSGVNLGKNYVLEYQQPGAFKVEAVPVVSTVPETVSKGDVIGYLDKPVVPDNKVYQSVSKDENKSHTHEPKAAIQYGNTGTGIVADRDEGGSSGTIAIELAEVVNLLGGEVASDGTMSLANQERKSSLSVGSTSEGFLSVGNGDNEASGQTDLFSEGEIAIENKDGEIGLENEENLWQGQAELAMAEGSILSDGRIVDEEDEKDKDEKKKLLEEKAEHESSAAITYGDVA